MWQGVAVWQSEASVSQTDGRWGETREGGCVSRKQRTGGVHGGMREHSGHRCCRLQGSSLWVCDIVIKLESLGSIRNRYEYLGSTSIIITQLDCADFPGRRGK